MLPLPSLMTVINPAWLVAAPSALTNEYSLACHAVIDAPLYNEHAAAPAAFTHVLFDTMSNS